jgi:hypothetical protein
VGFLRGKEERRGSERKGREDKDGNIRGKLRREVGNDRDGLNREEGEWNWMKESGDSVELRFDGFLDEERRYGFSVCSESKSGIVECWKLKEIRSVDTGKVNPTFEASLHKIIET